jgi:hypothetical protein
MIFRSGNHRRTAEVHLEADGRTNRLARSKCTIPEMSRLWLATRRLVQPGKLPTSRGKRCLLVAREAIPGGRIGVVCHLVPPFGVAEHVGEVDWIRFFRP